MKPILMHFCIIWYCWFEQDTVKREGSPKTDKLCFCTRRKQLVLMAAQMYALKTLKPLAKAPETPGGANVIQGLRVCLPLSLAQIESIAYSAQASSPWKSDRSPANTLNWTPHSNMHWHNIFQSRRQPPTFCLLDKITPWTMYLWLFVCHSTVKTATHAQKLRVPECLGPKASPSTKLDPSRKHSKVQ